MKIEQWFGYATKNKTFSKKQLKTYKEMKKLFPEIFSKPKKIKKKK